MGTSARGKIPGTYYGRYDVEQPFYRGAPVTRAERGLFRICADPPLLWRAIATRPPAGRGAPRAAHSVRVVPAPGSKPMGGTGTRRIACDRRNRRATRLQITGDAHPQEFQIARMLARGATTRQTAASLYLSPKTVEYHLRSVYGKLGVHSRAALAD